MRSTVNRLGAALPCPLTTVQALAGCAEMSQKNQASMAFVVSAAARPTATPASIRPDASCASATPPVVYERNQTANLRDGAGVSYRV